MGGPSQQDYNTQNQITQSQLNLSQQEFQQGQQNRQQMMQLLQPAINLNTQLSSGDPAQIMASIAPALSSVTAGTSAAREQIMDQSQPGAGRDVALAQLPVNQANQIAGLESQSYLSSFDKLANIGSGLGSFSLQEIGASISGANTASSSNQALMNIKEQSKASTMGFLGSLAGAAGSAASGGAFGKL